MRGFVFVMAVLGVVASVAETGEAAQRFDSGGTIAAIREAQRTALIQQCGGNDPARAIAACSTLIGSPGSAGLLAIAYGSRALAHVRRNEFDEALADYDHAIVLDAKNAANYFSRGNVRAERGELDLAIADFDRAIALNPDYGRAYNNRGTAEAGKRNYAAALADFGKAIELEPNADAYANRGLLQIKRGNNAEAVADLEEAVRRDPNHAQAIYNRGFAKQLMGDTVAAEADYAKARAIDPKVPY